MKLLFCKQCSSLFNIKNSWKKCTCGKSGGRYTDNVDITFHGPCVFLEIPIEKDSWVSEVVSEVLDTMEGKISDEVSTQFDFLKDEIIEVIADEVISKLKTEE